MAIILYLSRMDVEEKRINDKGKEYNFKDVFYFPTINDCLVKYLKIVQKSSKDVEDCIRITNDTFNKIRSLK